MALPPGKTGDAETTASAGEPASLLAQISATTAPNVAAALRLIEDGRQHIRQGAYDAALDRLERAVAIDPTNAYGYYFLAKVNFLKKSYDQAVAFASRAASLGRRADPGFRGSIYSLQGAAFEQVGRYPDARRSYQQAIVADPQNVAARIALARISGGP
jgi:Flp pilus assembly protein TadD